MQVLIIGGGGREHALTDAAARSPRVDGVLCAPGNAGTAAVAENAALDPMDFDGLATLAKQRHVDLTIVGPEAPLCAGIVDRFQAEGLRIFGPSKAAARIEGDKAYAKELMRRYRVATAGGRCFTDYRAAESYVASRETPQVVKAAGLAAGKGVVVCDDPAQAILVLEAMMVEGRYGQAGKTVVVEDRLQGPEVSVLALVDGNTLYVLEGAQDHKALHDGDRGPNTGGMGAYSPVPVLTDDLLNEIQRDILVPIVDGLRSDGAPYRGVLYAGLMLTAGGPKVLEFNCRFGDPEAQVILRRLKSDLIEAVEATIDGRLDEIELTWDERPCVCVVMAAGGYPDTYEKGKMITGLSEAEQVPDVKVYHAGTQKMGDRVLTNGGRVLGVTALGDTLPQARERAYRAVEQIHFEGAHYRRDIAGRAAADNVRSSRLAVELTKLDIEAERALADERLMGEARPES